MSGYVAGVPHDRCHDLQKLPAEAKRYLTRIEELAECRIDMISTGSRRDETIILNNPLKAGRRARSKRSR